MKRSGSIVQLSAYDIQIEGRKAMEARALSPRADRSCVIVDQRKEKEKWEQPKGTGRREVLPDIKIRSRAILARTPLLIFRRE